MISGSGDLKLLLYVPHFLAALTLIICDACWNFPPKWKAINYLQQILISSNCLRLLIEYKPSEDLLLLYECISIQYKKGFLELSESGDMQNNVHQWNDGDHKSMQRFPLPSAEQDECHRRWGLATWFMTLPSLPSQCQQVDSARK